jgi:hypothetical protein
MGPIRHLIKEVHAFFTKACIKCHFDLINGTTIKTILQAMPRNKVLRLTDGRRSKLHDLLHGEKIVLGDPLLKTIQPRISCEGEFKEITDGKKTMPLEPSLSNKLCL